MGLNHEKQCGVQASSLTRKRVSAKKGEVIENERKISPVPDRQVFGGRDI
jgi:hypothetical protein